MFKQADLLFIYTETPLHAGSGRGLGAIDLPIQREKVTNYPLVQGSSLKGRLRGAIREKHGWEDTGAELTALFGKAGGEGDNWAGAVSPGDAKLLLFPVRSLAGVFAWVTSVDVLARFVRDARAAEMDEALLKWTLPEKVAENECLVANDSAIAPNNQVTLEEFTYHATQDQCVNEIAHWLKDNALPQFGEYEYWRNNLAAHLVILPREDFRDFTESGTEVATRVKLVPDIKTVQSGALWTEESLPTDTLLYAPLVYGDSRMPKTENTIKTCDDVKRHLRELNGQRTQLGGDETTGRGVVMMRFLDKTEVKQ